MNTRHLLIVAHGSRRQASNEEVRLLGEKVAQLQTPGLDHIEVAFLELASPSIPEGLAHCRELGASEIVIFPYFLAAGTHVAHDIPEAMAAFHEAHPEINIRLTPHLGASDALPTAILEVASCNKLAVA